MRRAYPYTAFEVTGSPAITETPSPNTVNTTRAKSRPMLPMDTPTLAFRNHFNTPSEVLRGIETKGSLAFVVPIHRQHDTTSGSQENVSPHQGELGGDATISSNTVTGGTVKGYIRPNTIRVAVLVARNLYSPTAHPGDAARTSWTAKIPPAALKPSKDLYYPPKPSGGKGMGGNFTIPAPLALVNVPTSSTWMRGRFR